MSKLTEVIDSLNDENASEIKEQLKTEADALNDSNRQLYQRAKKAEGFEYNKDSKEWIKKEVKEIKEESKTDPKPNTEPTQSNEPDYARIAFLEQRKISHPDDQKLVQEEAERLKLPLTDILGMEHIKSKLKETSDQRSAEEGMPKGRGSSSSSTSNKVEHWVDKRDKEGNYVTPDDPELANQVIEKRIQKESRENKFSGDLYTG